MQIADLTIRAITQDSRAVRSGDLFIARVGATSDGRDYAHQAIANGAVAIAIADKATAFEEYVKNYPGLPSDIPVFLIPDTIEFYAKLAAEQSHLSHAKLKTVGVTGTNGKTSISHFIAQIATMLHKKTAVIGTVGNGIWPNILPASHTTPDVFTTHRLLTEYAQSGAQWCAMEVSSHALDQGRVAAVPFEVAIWSNLTQDHLDYHGTMQAYFEAKSQLFLAQQPYYTLPKIAILNLHDEYAQRLAQQIPDIVNVIGFGIADHTVPLHTVLSIPQIVAHHVAYTQSGTTADIVSPWGSGFYQSPLIGECHLQNMLAAIAACVSLGGNFDEIMQAIPHIQAVAGRLERVSPDSHVIVDYAHTPDALARVLQTVRQLCPGKLFCVFGCGGNRDATKRPLMGEIAYEYADQIILTNDNPRNEDPLKIIKEITENIIVEKIHIEPDRAAAIHFALESMDSGAGDWLVIAGKGHETYQEIAGKRYPFCDRTTVNEFLRRAYEKVDVV